jgi:hypothetical protein
MFSRHLYERGRLNKNPLEYETGKTDHKMLLYHNGSSNNGHYNCLIPINNSNTEKINKCCNNNTDGSNDENVENFYFKS